MKPVKQILQRTPLHVGNIIAWVVMAASAGFALGWILATERLWSVCFVAA